MGSEPCRRFSVVVTLVLHLIGRDEEPRITLTNADIEAAFEAEEIERYGQ